MRLRVVWVKGNEMDVDVPALDARISGLRVDHPDIALLPSEAKAVKSKAQLSREIVAVLGKPKCRLCDD